MVLGKVLELNITVTEDMLASKMGSGLVDVFATPRMIAFMEAASSELVSEDIGEGNVTVGVLVNVKHLAATPLGMQVKFVSELTAVDGKMLTFNVSAFDEAGKIGEGTHTRAIVNKEKFESRANGKKA